MEWFFVLVVVGIVIYYFSKRDKPTKENENETRIEIKPISGEKQKEYKRRFKTKVVGVTFDNLDGSSRQNAIGNLQLGQRLTLVWNPNDSYDSNAIMVCGEGSMSHVEISSCIGHLKADLAVDLVKHIHNKNSEGIYAEVSKFLGGTRDKPTLGCVIEIGLY